MYYSSGNYEAFARPKKPEGVDNKSAYIVGSGLAALTAACYLVRDGQMKGEHIHLLEKLELFREQYPHVRLRLFNHSTPQAVQALKNYAVDFAIVTTPISIRKPLQKKSLLRYREILVCGSKYKDLTTAPISIHELQDLPFVGLAEGTSTREMYMNYFMENRVSFHPDIEAATTDQVLPMIVHNLGIGFYPEPLAREVINDGKIFALQLKEPLPQREVCLVTNSSTTMSTAVKKAIEFIV